MTKLERLEMLKNVALSKYFIACEKNQERKAKYYDKMYIKYRVMINNLKRKGA